MTKEELMLEIKYIGIEDNVAYEDISLGNLIKKLTNAQDSIYNMSLYFDFANGNLEFNLKETIYKADWTRENKEDITTRK